MIKKIFKVSFVVLALVGVGAFVQTASASHAWGNYHWAHTVSPFTLKLGDNVSTTWDSHLAGASADWSVSDVLDTTVVSGSSNPRNCRATAGMVQVCDYKYGNNGWLGIASVWANGNHITQGTVKMNDTYFNTSKYNTPAWRNLVMCQEVGHTFGLAHQDEIFDNPNLGTCMDYTNDPSTNQHPNLHDYEMLDIIYTHLDSITTVSQTLALAKQEVDHNDPATWGKKVHASSKDHGDLYERDFGNGNKVFTFVVWAK